MTINKDARLIDVDLGLEIGMGLVLVIAL